MDTINSHKISTAKLDEILKSYDYKKSSLIAILQKVQEEYRYLPEEALIYIGTKVEGLSPATVFPCHFSTNPTSCFCTSGSFSWPWKYSVASL